MAKPADTYQWASDVGVTMDPGSTRKATGFVAGKKAPSKWFNWLHRGAGLWHAYVNNLHNETDFLSQAYTWSGAHRFGALVGLDQPRIAHATNELLYADAANVVAARARHVWLPMEPFERDGTWTYSTSNGTWTTTDAGGALHFMVGRDFQPSGATLTEVRVALYLPTGRGVDIAVDRIAYDGGSTPANPTVTSLGTATTGALVVAHQVPVALSAAIDNSASTLRVSIVGDGSSGVLQVRGIRLAFNDPGPRNF
jgi:hypothetical protein